MKFGEPLGAGEGSPAGDVRQNLLCEKCICIYKCGDSDAILCTVVTQPY